MAPWCAHIFEVLFSLAQLAKGNVNWNLRLFILRQAQHKREVSKINHFCKQAHLPKQALQMKNGVGSVERIRRLIFRRGGLAGCGGGWGYKIFETGGGVKYF